MREAKRRRQREVGPVPVDGFRAPDGYIAFTLDIAGQPPFSVCIPLAEFDGLIEGFGRHIGPEQANDLLWHARARLALVTTFKDGQQREAAMMGLALVFNYPGGDARKKVCDQIRRTDSAHVTMAISRDGLMATAVADRFVDLDEILVLAEHEKLANPMVVVADSVDDAIAH